MLNIFAITIPIYLIIGIGFIAVRFDLFTASELRAPGKFVVNFAVPALLFTALSLRPVGNILHGSYLLAYTGGSLAMFFAGAALARFGQGKDMPLTALSGLGMSSSNSALIGYPIAVQAVGPSAAVALAMCTLVENVLMLPMTLALAEAGGGEDRKWHGVLHPLMVLAVAWMLPSMDRDRRTAAVVFASVPMLSLYPIWAQRYHQEGFCAAALLVTTLLSFATVSAMLWIMSTLS